MTLDLPPVTQVQEADGTPIGNVGDAEMNNIFNSIKIPQQGYQSAEKEEVEGTPAPTKSVPITKPEEEKEPVEEEGGQPQQPSMLRTGIEEKLRGFKREVEA